MLTFLKLNLIITLHPRSKMVIIFVFFNLPKMAIGDCFRTSLTGTVLRLPMKMAALWQRERVYACVKRDEGKNLVCEA